MKIQIFTPYYPFPPTEGAFLVISEQSKRLAELGHEVELVYWKGKGSRSAIPNIRVRKLKYEEPAIPNALRVAKSLLSKWSSPELFFYPREVIATLAELPACDLRIFHFSFVSAWLGAIPKNAGKTVVVFHNLESSLYGQRARGSLSHNAIGALIHAWNGIKLRWHEDTLLAGFDEIWFLSPKDRADFAARAKSVSSRLRLFPIFFSEEYLKSKRSLRKKATDSRNVGFVGGLHFRPNQLSADWILDRLAPDLERNGFAGKLQIAGKSPPSGLVKKAKQFKFVEIMGFVPDLSAYWSEMSFSLSPHLEGSGVRTKLWESLASGIPVLTHRAALGQIVDELKSHPLLHASDSPKEWADILCGDVADVTPDPAWEKVLTNPPAWFNERNGG